MYLRQQMRYNKFFFFAFVTLHARFVFDCTAYGKSELNGVITLQ
jgi:hypothetical protein